MNSKLQSKKENQLDNIEKLREEYLEAIREAGKLYRKIKKLPEGKEKEDLKKEVKELRKDENYKQKKWLKAPGNEEKLEKHIEGNKRRNKKRREKLHAPGNEKKLEKYIEGNKRRNKKYREKLKAKKQKALQFENTNSAQENNVSNQFNLNPTQITQAFTSNS